MIKGKKGFTLIELVITFMIVVIVFGVLASLVGFSTEFFRDENSQVATQESLRLVAVNFEKDVRRYALDSTKVTQSGSCYTLGSTITYCYVSANNEITRNGTVIAEGVSSFSLNLTSSSFIRFNIVSVQDTRGHSNVLTMDIYYRTERTG
jgi:type II secretory pathway pseudopilin PulG